MRGHRVSNKFCLSETLVSLSNPFTSFSFLKPTLGEDNKFIINSHTPSLAIPYTSFSLQLEISLYNYKENQLYIKELQNL